MRLWLSSKVPTMRPRPLIPSAMVAFEWGTVMIENAPDGLR